jgi:hypothetical protein
VYFNTKEGVDFGLPPQLPEEPRVVEIYNQKLCTCKASGHQWYEDTTKAYIEIRGPMLLAERFKYNTSPKKLEEARLSFHKLQLSLYKRIWEECARQFKAGELAKPKSTRDGEDFECVVKLTEEGVC